MTFHQLEGRFISSSVQRERWFKRNVRKHHDFSDNALGGFCGVEFWKVPEMKNVASWSGKLDFFNGFRVSLEYNAWKTFLILLVYRACVNIGRTARQHRSHQGSGCMPLAARQVPKEAVSPHQEGINRDVAWRLLDHLRSMYIYIYIYLYIFIFIYTYIYIFILNVIYKYIVVCIHMTYVI